MTEVGAATSGLAVIVLAGGESRRFGSDKLVALLDGRTLLEHALDGIPAGTPIAVIGPERPLPRAVIFLREDPPGGGPAAGLITGLHWALDQQATVIATLPGDAPAGGRAALRLVRALTATGLAEPQNPTQVGKRSIPGAAEPRNPTQVGKRSIPGPAESQNPTQVGKRSIPGLAEPQNPTQVGKRGILGLAEPQNPTQVGKRGILGLAEPQNPTQVGKRGILGLAEPQNPTQVGKRSIPGPAEPQNPTQVGKRGILGPAEPQNPTQVGKRDPNPDTGIADREVDPGPDPGVVVAVDAEGREQVLQLALRPSTARALIELAGPGAGQGESVRRLLHRLPRSPRQVELPADLTSDIDTTAQLRARR